MNELKFIELKLVKEYCRVSSGKFDDTLTRLCNGAFDTIQNTIQRTIYANSEAQDAANDGAGDPDGIVINDDIITAALILTDGLFYKKIPTQSSEKRMPFDAYRYIQAYRKMGL